MTQPNQYTETVTVQRRFSSPKLILGYDIQEGTAEPMSQGAESKVQLSPRSVTITYECKTLATHSAVKEWAVTYVTVQGPRILASGKLGKDIRWTDSGWPCLDGDDMDSYPRWLVQLIMVNLPKMVPFLGEEFMTMETSWEDQTHSA